MSKPPVPFAPETLETIQRAFRLASDRRHDTVGLDERVGSGNQPGDFGLRIVLQSLQHRRQLEHSRPEVTQIVA